MKKINIWNLIDILLTFTIIIFKIAFYIITLFGNILLKYADFKLALQINTFEIIVSVLGSITF